MLIDRVASLASISEGYPGTLTAVCLVSATGTSLAMTRMRRLAHEAEPRIPPQQLILQLLPFGDLAGLLLRYWKVRGRDRLRAQVYLDFRLIPAYVALAVSIELLLAMCIPGESGFRLAGGVTLIWVAAGLVDVVENFMMLAVLSPTLGPDWQPGVFVSAFLKWTLVILGVLGVLRTSVGAVQAGLG